MKFFREIKYIKLAKCKLDDEEYNKYIYFKAFLCFHFLKKINYITNIK